MNGAEMECDEHPVSDISAFDAYVPRVRSFILVQWQQQKYLESNEIKQFYGIFSKACEKKVSRGSTLHACSILE